MGMTDNQLLMVKALAENRIQDAKKCAIACCVEDTTKKNAPYVRRYQALLQNRGPELIELPPNLTGLLRMEDMSRFQESRYYLGKKEAEVYRNIERTNRTSMQLLEIGIRYLNSTLLYGPPGTWKTMFGQYVAYKLGLPFAYVNFSFLINSLMGDTSKNLRLVIDYCKGQQCVLMLDEIDCIGMKRSGGSGGVEGELARTTITLMQEMDLLTNEQILIAATNRYDRLDPALLRRFSQKAEILPFDEDERIKMAEKFLDDIPEIRYDRKKIEEYACAERTQAEIIQFAISLLIREVEKRNTK